MNPGRMSPVVTLGVNMITPFIVLIAVYITLAGHNRPGGGFAAGLLLGGVIVLRAVTGLRRPSNSSGLLGVGGLIVAATAIAPLFWGDVLLDQVVIDESAGALGTLKTGTALVFDIGVVAIVVGLVVAALDGFVADRLAESAPRSTVNDPAASHPEVER
jgi:multisubunit Na+/H+ antiporter MnhB subunit